MREVKERRFLVGRVWRMRNIKLGGGGFFSPFFIFSFFLVLLRDLENPGMNDCFLF